MKNLLAPTLILSLVLELITCIFRFGFQWQSTRDTEWIGTLTLGYRVHHGYIGVLLLAAAFVFKPGNRYRKLLMIVGGALIISDLVHHFLVLWPITGSPQFDIRYRG